MKKYFKFSIFFLVLLAALLSIFFAFQKKESNSSLKPSAASLENQRKDGSILKSPVTRETASTQTETAASPSLSKPDPPPQKFLLQIPFYSQAPLGKWDKVHEEMCEEASLLNVGLYLQNKKISTSEYDRELLNLKDLGEKLVGTWVSTTIAETKKLSDAYFGENIKSKIIDNPTIEDMQAEITAGNPVIVPLAGREIGNPNFTPPGPIYHMLVVKGYDDQNFITNDVGTRKGNSYAYPKKIIMEKMHDWNPQDIHLGMKRVLVLYE